MRIMYTCALLCASLSCDNSSRSRDESRSDPQAARAAVEARTAEFREFPASGFPQKSDAYTRPILRRMLMEARALRALMARRTLSPNDKPVICEHDPDLPACWKYGSPSLNDTSPIYAECGPDLPTYWE